VRPERLIVSFHGMPVRYLTAGDPYHCQCRKTARLLGEWLGLAGDEMVVTFQSRFGPEEWLQPATVGEVARLAREGIRRIAVIAPAFAADCVETLEEIRGEIAHAFAAAGGERFTYIPCLNDRDDHIAMMAAIAGRELQGWL
jgi:ferrochelatase